MLLVGLFAGALVARSHRTPLLIASDALRADIVRSVPGAAIAGTVRIEQCDVVAFVEAALGSLFEIADRSYLPSRPGSSGSSRAARRSG